MPLSMVGARGALQLAGGTLNVYSQIGLITLVGLITKHGILIVEFSNQLRKQGRAMRDAVLEASSLRLRPILMTTGAMVLRALPHVVPTVYSWFARSRVPGEITERSIDDAIPAK